MARPLSGQPPPLLLGLLARVSSWRFTERQRDGGALRPRVRRLPRPAPSPSGAACAGDRLGLRVGRRVPPGEDAGDAEHRQRASSAAPAWRRRSRGLGTSAVRGLGGETRLGCGRLAPGSPSPRQPRRAGSRWHRATRATPRRSGSGPSRLLGLHRRASGATGGRAVRSGAVPALGAADRAFVVISTSHPARAHRRPPSSIQRPLSPRRGPERAGPRRSVGHGRSCPPHGRERRRRFTRSPGRHPGRRTGPVPRRHRPGSGVAQ